MNEIDKLMKLYLEQNAIREELPKYTEDFKKIKFCFVIPDIPDYQLIDGLHVYPSADDVRKFRLGRKDVVWLQELNYRNCKVCNGTGIIGESTYQSNYPNNKLQDLIVKKLEKSSIDELAVEIVKAIGHAPNMVHSMKLLLDMALDEVTNDNLDLVAKKYVKKIKNDFILKDLVYCSKCFIPNFIKKVNEVLTNIHFSVGSKIN